jgi:hypothetical protein
MKKACRSHDRQLGDQEFIVCLCFLLFFCSSVRATESPIESGVAKDRWYVQNVPEDDFPLRPLS